MSLFDANLVEIKLYYTFKERNNSKFLVLLADEKAEKMLENEGNGVETLITQWSVMSWKEQNASVNRAYGQSNPATGERVFDHISYRDSIIKSCLKQWDIAVNGQPVPVSTDAIDKLPGDIVLGLYNKYEKIMDYSEEELGN